FPPGNTVDGDYFSTFFNNNLKHVSVSEQSTPVAQFLDQVYAQHNYDLTFLGVNLFVPDLINDYFSTNGTQNVPGFSSKDVDDALTTFRTSLDVNARKAAIDKVGTIVLQQQFVGFGVYRLTSGDILNSSKISWPVWSDNIPIWENVWIKQ